MKPDRLLSLIALGLLLTASTLSAEEDVVATFSIVAIRSGYRCDGLRGAIPLLRGGSRRAVGRSRYRSHRYPGERERRLRAAGHGLAATGAQCG